MYVGRGLEDRLRRLRDGPDSVPAQVRACDAKARCIALRIPRDAGKLAALVPSQTRWSEENEAVQQFSTADRAWFRCQDNGGDQLPTISCLNHRLGPAVYPFRYFAAEGGLISYGPDLSDQYRRAAGNVDSILKGEKPADLPVQKPAKYELTINLKTAKALGLDVPLTLRGRADAVIE
jgi:ABC transporter substrate binding protein